MRHNLHFTYAAPFPTSFLALDTAVFPVLSDIHQGKYLEDNTAAHTVRLGLLFNLYVSTECLLYELHYLIIILRRISSVYATVSESLRYAWLDCYFIRQHTLKISMTFFLCILLHLYAPV